MKPFDPFTQSPGQVEKRPGGPYAAAFEEQGDSYSVKWTAKQIGGEQRDAVEITPEMRAQIERLMEDLNPRQ